MGTLGSGSGSGSVCGGGESIPRGPMEKFTTSQARRSTLNSKWKQEERKCVEKLVVLYIQMVFLSIL